jgi:hypothetical protein
LQAVSAPGAASGAGKHYDEESRIAAERSLNTFCHSEMRSDEESAVSRQRQKSRFLAPRAGASESQLDFLNPEPAVSDYV